MKEPRFRTADLAKLLRAKLFLQNPEVDAIDDLLTDSRKLIDSKVNLFVALVSTRNDGHRYIQELANKGVANFLVSQLPDDYEHLSANFILVPDTLAALQTLSAAHRRKFNIPVVGITGSNGKTIIKEWIYQCLHSDFHICRSPKSYNSQIGVPLSVFQLQPGDDFGIFEAGISEHGEMTKLEKVIQPTIGIFTNIGDAHHERFVDMRQKVNEKLNLFVKVSTLIFCRDHQNIAERIYNLDFFKEKNLLDWSRKNKEASFYVQEVTTERSHTSLVAIWKKQPLKLQIQFTDEAAIENAIHLWLLLLYLDFSQEDIQERMSKLTPIAMRMELREGINNCSIINDSYNSDLNALVIALDFLLQQQQHSKKTVILSDIMQSGKTQEDLYSQVAQIINQKKISRIIGIGIGLKLHQALFQSDSVFFDTTEEFLQYFPFSTFSNETILLKGARNYEFERINKALGKKIHQTRLEVNLNAMLDNFNFFRSLLRPQTKTMIMVKAFSYGSGSFEVANLLQFHHADYLAVAYADEGIDLRKAGIRLPIMVMNPEMEALESIFFYQLEPEIYSFKILSELDTLLQGESLPISNPIGIHLKLDTGMHRLGFDESEVDALIAQLKVMPNITIRSVFSHLASSEDPQSDQVTNSQIHLFDKISQKIQAAFDYSIMRHIANSAAISRFPEAQFDMVRIGIGLYGVGSDSNIQNNLKVVSTLKTIISQIKTLKKGDKVGYNGAFEAPESMRIATIPIGYADGFDRRFGLNRGKVLINGQILPIIGKVCMDMCMVDLQQVSANEGDEVCLFGDKLSITELANLIGTIPYELFTSISPRVKRIYLQE